jgi:hypothetical protein
MRNLRNLLLLTSGIAFAACATQTFRPGEAPEYVTTRDPTPFYLREPAPEGVPDASLSPKTRVKLLRQKKRYSLVQLEDSLTGYVANAYLAPAPPGSQERPIGAPTESGPQPSRKKRPSAIPTPQPSQTPEAPSGGLSAPPTSTPAPDAHAPPKEVPSPTPRPEAPLEKPKFRL